MNKNMLILGLVIAAIVAVIVMNNTNKQSGLEAQEGVDAVQGAEQAPEAPKKGWVAPAFQLSSLDGTTDYKVGGKRDKVLIINFWAAWCGPCEVEAPDLVDINAKHNEQVDLYAVNATNYDKLREANDFVKEQGFVFPVLTDPKGTAGDLYKVFSFPTSFIVNRDGVITQRIEGVVDREQWELYLQEALAS